MSLAQVADAVFTRLAGLAGLPTIYYQNIDYDTPTEEHIRATVLPANTETRGLVNQNIERGIINISIFVPQGVGIIGAAGYAATVLTGFPRNLDLGNQIRIDVAGYVEAGIVDGGWYQLPIIIPYLQIS